MSDVRLAALKQWLIQVCDGPVGDLSPVAGDASFRRYFRVTVDGKPYIAMDAPPPQEDSARFTRLARAFAGIGVRVPGIRHEDEQQGFVLLEDFGDELLWPHLNADSVDGLYGSALDELFLMQRNGTSLVDQVPAYDRALLERELGIFSEWLLQHRLGLTLDEQRSAQLRQVYEILVENALQQPRVLVHRDYHSRNLLVLASGVRPGVIDFQDAVIGPVTYDLVSLLRDCYIRWPAAKVDSWARAYFQRLVDAGLLDTADVSEAGFMRWFDLMGMQRHLKAAGIFCRLSLRDGRDGYLPDIPRTLGYVVDVADGYPEFGDFAVWMRGSVLPHFHKEVSA